MNINEKVPVLIILLIVILLISQPTYSQTHFVSDYDTNYLTRYREQTFKNNLADGRWVSLSNVNDTTSKHIVANFKNGLKQGVENRYYNLSKEKYAEVNYKDGLKHGQTIHWNTNKTVNYQITYYKGALHGRVIVNHLNGEKNFDGWFKNGVQDSVWTYYYFSTNENRPQKNKEINYIHGIPFMLNAWNKNGDLTFNVV